MQTNVKFTTDGLAVGDRLSYWNDIVSNTFVPSSVRTVRADAFRATLHTEQLGRAKLSVINSSPQWVARTDALIRRSSDECLMLGCQTNGHWIASQHGETVKVAPKQFFLYDSNYPFELHFDDDFDLNVLQFPRKSFPFAYDKLLTPMTQPLDSSSGVGKILLGLLDESRNLHASSNSYVRASLGDAAINLATSLIAGRLGIPSGRITDQSSRIVRIKMYIEQNLASARLSPSVIASENGISLRLLHSLFTREDRSVSAYIVYRRLLKCKEDLANSRLDSITIGGIGMRWGFWSGPYFSREFKSAFGVSPRAFRSTRQTERP